MEKYIRFIEDLANTESETPYTNKGEQHASIVMGNIFRTSKNIIEMYSGNFDNSVTNKDYFLDNLIQFLLKPDTKLRLILEGKPDKASISYKLIESFNGDKVEIKKEAGQLFYFGDDISQKVHFAIGDGRMYRIETDSSLKKAQGCFNDVKNAKMLSEMFNTQFNKLSN